MLAGVAVTGLMAFPAMAEDGQYAPQLTRIIGEASQGTCLAALMAQPLLDPIETMTFVSAQDTPEGKVETYSVKFTSGRTMNWFIGQERDGKFSVVGAGG
jgi:hypothetical protein